MRQAASEPIPISATTPSTTRVTVWFWLAQREAFFTALGGRATIDWSAEALEVVGELGHGLVAVVGSFSMHLRQIVSMAFDRPGRRWVGFTGGRWSTATTTFASVSPSKGTTPTMR